MSARSEREQALLAKIRDLSDGRVAEVEDFVEFLHARDAHRDVVQAATATQPHNRGVMSDQQRDAGARLDRVYEQCVKPVEQDHLGEYVLVTSAGEMYFASTQLELIKKTRHVTTGDNCLFKVGEIAATKIL